MYSRPPPSLLHRALLAAALLCAMPAAATDIVTFSRGSLIIPENASFQQGCGALSAYGLVWRILQSNQAGGPNAANPVTVYLAINDQKQSPNRCVPTNRHTPPEPRTDTRWNDGCDFTITNTAQQPVVQVDYDTAFPAGGVYPNGDIDNFATAGNAARPYFDVATLNNTVTNPRFTTVRYSGGAFIIAAEDAQRVIEFIRSGSGDLSPEKFRTRCGQGGVSRCDTFRNTPDRNTVRCHHVRMHQATIEFTAPVARRINRVPPKIALLDRDETDNDDRPGGGSSYVKGGMLDDYLRNAGLDFAGAGGCPEGTTSGCNRPPGLIYDALHANRDLISTSAFPHGLLNAVDPVTRKPRYKVFWAPHWELGNSNYNTYVSNGDGSLNQKENVLNNIAYFGNQRGNGVFAECASLHAYETTLRANGQPVQSSRFQTSGNFVRNPLGGQNDTWDGRNCTDPDYLAMDVDEREKCMLYPNPGDPFSQVGDFRFNSVVGHTTNYSATYKTGVRRLAVSWYQYRNGERYDNATDVSRSGWRGKDFFSFNQKDNDPEKATIVYLAGHDFKDSVAGTRIVLNTLLNLGSEPVGSERALTAPVAYDDLNGNDANGTRALLFAATYDAVSGYPPGVDTYDPIQGSHWVFPYFPGHLRAHSIIGGNALAAGQSALEDATLWDADAMLPLPGARNIFTYFGGQVTENPALGAERRAPRGVMQVGWRVQSVAGTAINDNYGLAPNPRCVDVLKLGQAPNKDGTFRFDFVSGADGVCDLQQAVQFTPQLAGNDYGASTETVNKNALRADFNKVAQMLQRVRGFCFATQGGEDGSGAPILTPGDNDCNNPEADNRAHLGGFANSTPAVVGPSSNIQDRNNRRRPTVVYAAGLDGQLHAFYVSGGARYEGPATAREPLHESAEGAFATDWAARFRSGTLPEAGTELWSFMPATQLPWLRSNNARVDSSPIVQDVFADFLGNGRREWRTVLVANVGKTGRDLFALDITNPLKPALLWHLVGSHAQQGTFPPHAPVALADRDIRPPASRESIGVPFAVKWHEPTSIYRMAPETDPGRIPTGLYDYSELGGTRALSMGRVRQGLEPTYVVFVASNSSGAPGVPAMGVEVFAIDASNGQKLWQWEKPYTQGWVDNTSPIAPSVVSDSSGAARVYVGDMEGRVWELEGATGMNVNVSRQGPACTPAAPCKYAALDTQSTQAQPRPITTNVAVARLPAEIAEGSAFEGYKNETVALVGTGGVPWVPDTAAGQLHVALLGANRRLPLGVAGVRLNGAAISASQAHTEARAKGVLQEPPPFPLSFAAPKHFYGSISVAGRTAYFSTANDAVSDLMSLNALTGGSSYALDLGNTPTSPSAAAQTLPGVTTANYGGITVYHRDTGGTSTDYVLGLGVSSITNNPVTNGTNNGPSTPSDQPPTHDGSTLEFELYNWALRFFE
jgi:type IV pilus assembly protein PilY1